MSLYYYNRQGSKVSFEEYITLAIDQEYKKVVQTTLPNGIWVSTVLLGLDHSWNSEGPPLIFETMAFGNGELDDERACERATCEREALIHHIQICEALKEEPNNG